MDDLAPTAPAARPALAGASAWRLVMSGLPPETPRAARRGAQREHAHAHPELMLALWGEVAYGVGGAVWRCPPGTWLIIPPFEPHDVGYGDRAGGFGHLWISLVDERAFAFVAAVERGQRQRTGPLVAIPGGGEARHALEDARRLAATAPALARARAAGACATLAAALLAPREPPVGHGASQRLAIDSIMRHVAEVGGAGVGLRHLARIAGYSPFHFARVFRRHSGRTVHAYVDECRRRTVDDLLAAGAKHQDIAARLGFSCPSAFSRWLRGQRERRGS